MPYIPTNCWPHNCAVERSNDGYHFLGTIDKYDTIEDVYLNLYDENYNKVIVAKNKDMKIYNAQDNSFLREISNESTVPNYNFKNNIINLKLPVDNNNNNSEIKCVIKENDIKLYNDSYWVDYSDNSYCRFVCDIPLIFLKDEKMILNQTLTIVVTPPTSGGHYYGDRYNKIPIDYIKLNNNSISNQNVNVYLKPYGKRKHYHKNIFGYTGLAYEQCRLQISFSNYFFTINYEGQEYTFILSDYIDFQWIGRDILNDGNIIAIAGQYSDGILYNLKEAYINSLQIENKLQINSLSQNVYNQYFQSNKCFWNFKIFGEKYDVFIQEGIFESNSANNYLLIQAMETLEDGQKLNKNYYLKIVDNTFYLFNQGICTVEQIFNSSTNSYTYTIMFPHNLDNIIENKAELVFELGATELSVDKIFNQYSGGFTTFSLNYPLLIAERNLTQSIVYTFRRDNSRIKLYYDKDLTQEIEENLYFSFSNTSYQIKSNAITTSFFSFDIIDAFSFNLFTTINNKNIICEGTYPYSVKCFNYEIFEDQKLIYSSPDIYENEIKFTFPYGNIEKNYTIKCSILNEYNMSKTTETTIQIPEYITQKYNCATYDLSSKANVVLLSNLFSLPWYDSISNKIWLNGLELPWYDVYEAFNINQEIIINLSVDIYKYINNKEQLLVAQNLNLEPIWSDNSYSFDHLFYDYGICDNNSYIYEVFYNADCLIPRECVGTISLNNDNYYFNLKYFYINNNIEAPQLTINSEDEVSAFTTSNIQTTANSILFSGKFNHNGVEHNMSFKFDFSDSGKDIQFTVVEGSSLVSNINIVRTSYKDFENKTIAIVKSNDVVVNDWLGTTLYGVKYNYDENSANRYQLDDSNIWYFDLDTKSNTIDFTNERNVIVNNSQFPKIGVSNVNYMSSTITTKLGYLNFNYDEYLGDNSIQLNKFLEWSNDRNIKILRLSNGFLIPVDIILQTNTTNFSVTDSLNDISFSWTQIANHQNSVLYSLKEGGNDGFNAIQKANYGQ